MSTSFNERMDNILSSFATVSFKDKTEKLISNVQSKFQRRKCAVKHISKTILGHEFEPVPLWEPTFCSRCSDFIWGIVGHQCKLCKLMCEKKCFDLIKSRCAREPSNKVLLDVDYLLPSQLHSFEDTTFLTPTFCDHCGVLIKKLWKQGKQCSSAGCGMKVHHDCKNLVTDICGQRDWIKSMKQRSVGKVSAEDKPQVDDDDDGNKHDKQSWGQTRIEDFKLTGIISFGSFGNVYRAKQNGREYAIKVVKKTDPVVCAEPESSFTEMKVLILGRSHPFLTTIHCCFQSEDRLFYVMEYVGGQNLFYHRMKSRKFSEDRTRFYSAEIILALIYLHKRNIIHRDLKLENVLLDNYGHCKLSDFGMSKDLSVCKRTRTYCGTKSHMSPEVWDRLSYGPSVDWWALGVVMYDMLTGDLPFDENYGDDALYRQIKERDFESSALLSNEANSILKDLFVKDPDLRLGCRIQEGCEQEVLKHPFYSVSSAVDYFDWWKNVEDRRIKPPYIPKSEDILEPGDSTLSDSTKLTPIDSDQLKRIDQADFRGFSFRSESFINTDRDLIHI